MTDAIFFEPHDDDLIIGPGGAMIQLLKDGWDIKSVLMTDGRYKRDEIPPEELIEVRRKEKEEEVDFLGIECERLELEDGSLAKLDEDETAEVIERIKTILADEKPGYVFIPAPSEGHPDHRATHKMVEEAIEEIEHGPTVIYYLVWEIPFLGSKYMQLEKEIAVDIDSEFDRKIEGIKLHESQDIEGRYSEMAKHFNAYCSLLYSSYGDRENEYVEMLGVKQGEATELLETLNYSDVTDYSHGRELENITVETPDREER